MGFRNTLLIIPLAAACYGASDDPLDLHRDTACPENTRTTGPQTDQDTGWDCVCKIGRIRARAVCTGEIVVSWTLDAPVVSVGLLAVSWSAEDLERWAWVCLDHGPTEADVEGAETFEVGPGQSEIPIGPVSVPSLVFFRTESTIEAAVLVYPREDNCEDRVSIRN